MANQVKPGTGQESEPKDFPEVAPPNYAQVVGAGWIVESLMQMQHSMGELKANVDHLKDASGEHDKKLDRISHIIFASGVVLVIILAVGGFFLNKIWDGVFTLLKAVP